MRYIWQHISTIIKTYDGGLPLTHFLKSYCRQYPKLGSRDRRMLNDMAYSWYRCSKGVKCVATDTPETPDATFELKMRNCLQLCGQTKTIAQLFREEPTVTCDFSVKDIFTLSVDCSSGIKIGEWRESMLVQPDLFIRVRKNKATITGILLENEIPFTELPNDCISLPNGAKIDSLLPADSFVVQDASSQFTAQYFTPKANESWYDCCSGAGGKSLLLKDLEPSVKLTVSDVRETILHNLKERFRTYKHQPPVCKVVDVEDSQMLKKALGTQLFDNIICDAPCSGSGTWARTPEQLYFFKQDKLQEFSSLQKLIATNVSRFLKPGGKLFYITCSVFYEENEGVIKEILRNTQLKLVESKLINGIEQKADSMFIAVFES